MFETFHHMIIKGKLHLVYIIAPNSARVNGLFSLWGVQSLLPSPILVISGLVSVQFNLTGNLLGLAAGVLYVTGSKA